MTPVISELDWRMVSDLALDNDNPLMLGENGDETPTSQVISEALLDLGERRDAVAASLSRAYAAKERYADGRRDIDWLTAGLIAHVGLEPLMVAWLAATCDSIYIFDEDKNQILEIDSRVNPTESLTCGTMVVLGPNVVWEACGTMIVTNIPDALVLAAPGRPLASMVSHPLLDPLGLVINHVELPRDNVGAELQTNMRPIFPTVAELAQLEPDR